MAGRDASPDDDPLSDARVLLDSLPGGLLLRAGLDRGLLRDELGRGHHGG